MTRVGGAYNSGTIFSYDVNSGIETDVHDFGSDNDGKFPHSSMIKAKNGLLYGVTSSGGLHGGGVIFSYDITKGFYKRLYDLGSGDDGKYAYSALIQANDSILYGMTYNGGANDKGTIFNYNIATGKENVLHDFGSGIDGYWPWGSLIETAGNHLFYGMTVYGGAHDSGMIFSYNILTGKETDLHDFGSRTDGYRPWGSLTLTSNNLLYGMTANGGTNDKGTIFTYTISTGKEKVIHNFGNDADGSGPLGSLILANNGLLYGMTKDGGTFIKYITFGNGTIFSCNTDSTVTILHNFGDSADGIHPFGTLDQASNGLLYGMTELGGDDSCGIIFSYNITTGKNTVLHNFGGGSDGRFPYGCLIEDDIPQLTWWRYPMAGAILLAVVLFTFIKLRNKKRKARQMRMA